MNSIGVSVAGCLGYDVLATMSRRPGIAADVSVAGCLGYDVLVVILVLLGRINKVSVAGCLGYDVLATNDAKENAKVLFQLLVV